MSEKVKCPRCNEVMIDVQACHLICPNCGSPIISYVTEQPDVKFIKAGSLDDSSWLKIESSFWSDTANPWDPINENLPAFQKNPPL